MILKYEKAFCLRDNPFDPNEPLPNMHEKRLINDIVSLPLRIYEEPSLIKLYCPKAGLFEKNFNEFKELIEDSGYTTTYPTNSFKSFIFLISGSQGTGKTTLANTMVNHLKKCQLEDGNWEIFSWLTLGLGSNKFFSSSEEQINALSQLEEKIKNSGTEGYYCLIIDDLIAGAVSKALDIYDKFKDDNTIFLFLVTSDLTLRQKYNSNFKHHIEHYRTRNLTSNDAVELISHRLNYYRCSKCSSLYENYNLFPFDEDNIREAIESGDLSDLSQPGIITIRMLNGILSKSLKSKLQTIPEDFDLITISETTMDNKYLIDIVSSYNDSI